MMSSSRDIRRRIKSIGNTSKITKAMELVAAAKMRKAVKAVLETRAYARTAWQIIKELAATTDPALHPLLQTRKKIKKLGIILITSNRGLCGGFNREIIDQVALYIQNHKKQDVEVKAEVLLMGKKGRDIMFRHGHEIAAEFAKLDVTTHVSEVTPMAKMAMTDYIAGKYDKVAIAYTDYISAINQKPRIMQLLPLGYEDEMLGQVGGARPEAKQKESWEYLFEPSPDVVLEQMIEKLIELQVYQALLESNASEHSARMLAMRNANDSAQELIEDLTLSYNQTRQASITQEIAEISAGRAALE